MKTEAAVVYKYGKLMEIEELNLDGPNDDEVLIRCQQRRPVPLGPARARRSFAGPLPMVRRHEAGGIIDDLGLNRTCSFIPSCGVCR